MRQREEYESFDETISGKIWKVALIRFDSDAEFVLCRCGSREAGAKRGCGSAMLPATDYDELLFLLMNVLAGDRVLFKHNHKYYNVLQGGMDVAPSFPKASDVLLGTPGACCICFVQSKEQGVQLNYLKKLLGHIICHQEVHGKDEVLQAIQVLGPRFRHPGTLLPVNENAGGSAICIHRNLLPEDAIVTHVVTCQGRDHLVNIRSGQRSLVIVSVHF